MSPLLPLIGLGLRGYLAALRNKRALKVKAKARTTKAERKPRKDRSFYESSKKLYVKGDCISDTPTSPNQFPYTP